MKPMNNDAQPELRYDVEIPVISIAYCDAMKALGDAYEAAVRAICESLQIPAHILRGNAYAPEPRGVMIVDEACQLPYIEIHGTDNEKNIMYERNNVRTEMRAGYGYPGTHVRNVSFMLRARRRTFRHNKYLAYTRPRTFGKC